MVPSRREFLVAAPLAALPAFAAEEAKHPLGIVIHSFGVRAGADRKRRSGNDINDPIGFLDHCHTLGAAGIQTNVGRRDAEYLRKLHGKLDAYQMYLEGSVRLPKDQADAERFERELETLREAGATLARTVMLNGRRYETFADLESFRTWAANAKKSLAIAEPIAARKKIALAVENHKDWRSDELVRIIEKISSRNIGICIDTGNSVALLEEPAETVRTLAPWALTTHIKDMGVALADDGFLLAEVPLGSGYLDLAGIVAQLRKARPEVRLNLEMITRDPLRVPCLSARYWATFPELPGRHLAATLTMVRKNSAALPKVSELSLEEQLALEHSNVKKSLAFAQTKLR